MLQLFRTKLILIAIAMFAGGRGSRGNQPLSYQVSLPQEIHFLTDFSFPFGLQTDNWLILHVLFDRFSFCLFCTSVNFSLRFCFCWQQNDYIRTEDSSYVKGYCYGFNLLVLRLFTESFSFLGFGLIACRGLCVLAMGFCHMCDVCLCDFVVYFCYILALCTIGFPAYLSACFGVLILENFYFHQNYSIRLCFLMFADQGFLFF